MILIVKTDLPIYHEVLGELGPVQGTNVHLYPDDFEVVPDEDLI